MAAAVSNTPNGLASVFTWAPVVNDMGPVRPVPPVPDWKLTVAAAATVSFQSGTGGTQLTGAMTLAAGAQINTDANPFGAFETAAATLLNLHQAGVVQLSGFLIWCTAQ